MRTGLRLILGSLVFGSLVQPSLRLGLLALAAATSSQITAVAQTSRGGTTPAAAPGKTDKVVAAGMQQGPRMSFDFSNPGLTPAFWHMEFDASGLGHYHSQPGDSAPPDAHGASPEPFDQQIQISAPLREQLFAMSRSHHFFAYTCESPQHKVAFTGHKTVAYTGPDGHGSCTFNWSPDARLMKLANTFLAISLTLEEGRKLRLEYLHDRLSLDAELETLAEAVKNGNAMELENIASELQSIASDPAIMKRAQARAAALLAAAPPRIESAAIQPR